MKINRLPAQTFNTTGMNETDIDYTPGQYRNVDIYEDTIMTFDNPQDTNINVWVKEGKEVSVIMDYRSKDTLNISTRINIEKNGKLKLVQIDSAPCESRLINQVNARLEEEADFSIIQILPGRGDVYTGCTTDLAGNRSKCNMDIAYLVKDGQKTDMNFISNHYGKETECNINADGILKDGAFKLFRGTIDFKTGASGSKGIENEKVLLLGDDVINQTIPLILCTEEDVEGAHGAQIGSLDEDVLFYFASRGIDEKTTEKMISFGSFNRLLRQIDNETVRENTEKILSEVF